MLRRLRVRGYRSIRDVDLDLDGVTVVVGPNGSGKTNLYRALHLLHVAARGELSRSLADEGGMPSALWAGPRRRDESREIWVSVDLGDVAYELTCGLPSQWVGGETAFVLDPVVKDEAVSAPDGRRRVALAGRGFASAWIRDHEGARVDHPFTLEPAESLLAQLQEPHRYPELSRLQRTFAGWRFYHHFRTDPHAPLRVPQVGVRTVALAHDGSDLAAALQTIREIGDPDALAEAVTAAFPGAIVDVEANEGRFGVRMLQAGLRRPLDARELSDGTLRYLCLLAALASPRPPTFFALNEPETSLHPSLLAPLGKAIAAAATRSQVWVTTHSEALAAAIEAASPRGRVRRVELRVRDGATTVVRAAEEDDEDDD